MLVTACSGDASSSAVEALGPSERVAYVGLRGEGAVVLEALGATTLPDATVQSEESMLRERFGLPADRELLRLHLVGTGAQLADAGEVEVDGRRFESFDAAAADWPAARRLVWDGVLRGLPIAEEEGVRRRSLVVQAPADAATWQDADRVIWRAGEESLELERQVWNASSRLQTLDPPRAQPLLDPDAAAPDELPELQPMPVAPEHD